MAIISVHKISNLVGRDINRHLTEGKIAFLVSSATKMHTIVVKVLKNFITKKSAKSRVVYNLVGANCPGINNL